MSIALCLAALIMTTSGISGTDDVVKSRHLQSDCDCEMQLRLCGTNREGEIIELNSEIKPAIAESPTDQHFNTDHLLGNIGHRAVSGGVVTAAAQSTKLALTFAGAAILARLLSPKDFGIVGMVLGVVNVVGIFNELGLSTATVQRRDISQEQVSNLFWVNVGISGIVSVLSCGLAPLLAWFYHDPRITWITLALSSMFILTGSTVQHRALLTRQMRFRAIAVIEVTSTCAGFTTACLLAWAGISYWALVAQQVMYSLAFLVLTWSVSRWRPSLPSRGSGVRPMLSFGAHLTLADFTVRTVANFDSILIGRIFGAVQLGFYTRAYVLLARPLDQVIAPMGAVIDPVLARLQSDPDRYRRTFLRALNAMVMLVYPFSAVCMVLSKPLVLVILGAKWAGVIPLFSAFTLVAISWPLAGAVCWLYQSQGRGKDQLTNHLLLSVLMVLSYAVGLHWGALGLILTSAIVGVTIRLPIVYFIAGRRGPVSTRDLWSSFFRNLPAWGTVYVGTLLMRMTVPNLSPIKQVSVCAPTGLLLGIAVLMPFRRYREVFSSTVKGLKHALMDRRESRA
jgi:O-antigen/teichoic acid export membrane protein